MSHDIQEITMDYSQCAFSETKFENQLSLIGNRQSVMSAIETLVLSNGAINFSKVAKPPQQLINIQAMSLGANPLMLDFSGIFSERLGKLKPKSFIDAVLKQIDLWSTPALEMYCPISVDLTSSRYFKDEQSFLEAIDHFVDYDKDQTIEDSFFKVLKRHQVQADDAIEFDDKPKSGIDFSEFSRGIASILLKDYMNTCQKRFGSIDRQQWLESNWGFSSSGAITSNIGEIDDDSAALDNHIHYQIKFSTYDSAPEYWIQSLFKAVADFEQKNNTQIAAIVKCTEASQFIVLNYDNDTAVTRAARLLDQASQANEDYIDDEQIEDELV